jgi:hypothetical protein
LECTRDLHADDRETSCTRSNSWPHSNRSRTGNRRRGTGRDERVAKRDVVDLEFAAVILAALFSVKKRIQDSAGTTQNFVSSVVVDVVLLNPRIKEYDVASLTVPLLLLASRLPMKINGYYRRVRMQGAPQCSSPKLDRT